MVNTLRGFVAVLAPDRADVLKKKTQFRFLFRLSMFIYHFACLSSLFFEQFLLDDLSGEYINNIVSRFSSDSNGQ